MSQTTQPQQGTAPAEPRPRKDWELFWRIIAGLMLLIIGWIAWVLYQITPRSVVTPLVYEAQAKRSGAPQADAGAAAPSPQPSPAKPVAQDVAAGLPVPQAAPEVAAAALLMDQAQAAARSGAHQASADVQAGALEKSREQLERAQPIERDGLKLSPEITTPLTGKARIPGK